VPSNGAVNPSQLGKEARWDRAAYSSVRPRRILSSLARAVQGSRTSTALQVLLTTGLPEDYNIQGESSAPTGSRQSAPRSVCAHFSLCSPRGNLLFDERNKTLGYRFVCHHCRLASGNRPLGVEALRNASAASGHLRFDPSYCGFDMATANPNTRRSPRILIIS